NGSLVINSFDGVFRYHPSSKDITRIRLNADVIVNNLSDPVGDWLYLATYGSGLWKLNKDSEVAEYCNDIYSPYIDIAKSKIGSVYGADDGSLWIGVDFYGVMMLSAEGTSFIYRNISNIINNYDLPLSGIDVWKGNSVIGNSKGDIVIISKDGKVLNRGQLPEGGVITSIDVMNGDKAVLGVVESGVWELDLLTGAIQKILDIPEKYISVKVCAADDSCLYIGLYAKGLLKFNPKTGEKTWISPDKDGKECLSPFISSMKIYDDKIWLGSYGGLACFNIKNGSFEEIDQSPYMTCAVFDIVQESPESVLIGTSNGLIRYNVDSKEIEKYTTLEGLSDNDVRSIAIDGKGGKWIGTMRGINYEHPDGGRFIAYSGGNGMVERTFESMFYSPETEMIYAAGRMGLTSFIPSSLTVPVFKTALRVTDIYKKGKKMTPIDSSGFPDTINLRHNENSIAFRISTMDFRDTSNLKYLWRFADEKDWVELPDGTDLINLSSLAPGKYTLEFKAEEAGVESQISSIMINVAFPWYLTWYSKTVYVVILIVILYLCLTIVRKRQKERMNEKKMEFFMDMSHDMRSPLTLIIGPLESLLKEKLRYDVRQRIRGVYRNAHRILNIVNQLLDIKKIDYGRKRLICRKTKLTQFIGEIVDMFRPQAQDKGITLTFYPDSKTSDAWIDRSVIDRILVNLISNAIKYTPESGEVDIILNDSYDDLFGKCIKITVRDNGIGLGHSDTINLFQRHYRSESGESFAEDGYGLGLDICRRYINLHHGEIFGENRKDGIRGSVFIILIPLDKDRYHPEELVSEVNDHESDDKDFHVAVDTPDEDGRNKSENIVIDETESKSIGDLPQLKGNNEILIERVDKILDASIGEEDMNVDRLAQAVGVSRTHLYRRFKEKIGINPSEYIRNRRLQKACELLKNDDLDITQIAYALGFSSQSQFSTTFKRFMGRTPTEYRTKYSKSLKNN
ncbi:MAG: helix-turn-helix domain-containing protein, partial [Muribaculaceae bacterium]|nr:helix-turn-helix domain-containing protein [Muribaculaceae bacterium]